MSKTLLHKAILPSAFQKCIVCSAIMLAFKMTVDPHVIDILRNNLRLSKPRIYSCTTLSPRNREWIQKTALSWMEPKKYTQNILQLSATFVGSAGAIRHMHSNQGLLTYPNWNNPPSTTSHKLNLFGCTLLQVNARSL